MEKSKKIIVYTDGGSRGNPGPAALGVVIKDEKGNLIKKYGEALGVKRENEENGGGYAHGFRACRKTTYRKI